MHGESFCLLTGSTGFLGRHLLAELLRRGRRCAVALRRPGQTARLRLRVALADVGVDISPFLLDGRLMPIEWDLNDDPPAGGVPIDTIVHAAACTRFTQDRHGDPHRTNVIGTARLLRFAELRNVRELHLVSTAYACGAGVAEVIERLHDRPGRFHNAYEQSKWEAEHLCSHGALGAGRTLTIHRPSIIVGEHASGRTTKFDGFYIPVRATELLERRYAGASAEVRREIALRINAPAHARQNIVPVDWVARMIAGIVADKSLHGHVYHLTHADPPSNVRIKLALEEYFGISGGTFAQEQDPSCDRTEDERLFDEISSPIRHYLNGSLSFDRTNTSLAEQRLGLRCPQIDQAALIRLIDFAVRSRWGRSAPRSSAMTASTDTAISRYFEEFLPHNVGRSRVARATAMDAVIRFLIDDDSNGASTARGGDWLCRFHGGQLVEVQRGGGAGHEDFGYRATHEAFWSAISGEVHPQDLFLTGQAEIFGDVERALKMAMILNEFSREYPCDRRTLQAPPQRKSA